MEVRFKKLLSEMHSYYNLLTLSCNVTLNLSKYPILEQPLVGTGMKVLEAILLVGLVSSGNPMIYS